MNCIATKVWSAIECACVCAPQLARCQNGQRWDESFCSCVGPVLKADGTVGV